MRRIESIRTSDIERKQDLHRRTETSLQILSTVADILSGAALVTAENTNPKKALTAQIETDAGAIVQLVEALDTPAQAETISRAQGRARLRLDAGRPSGAPSRNPLHWPIAFPEVFNTPERTPGFDAMVGNPPFIGGQKITGAAGTDYRNHIIAWIASGTKGSSDLVAYFFLNATKISQSFGYLATNTIAQGDTSEVGLTQIIDTGWSIHRAIASTTWPGEATLEIAKVWATSHTWSGEYVLDGRPVFDIDEMLYPLSRSGWRKRRLAENVDKSFIGSYILGMGFTMSAQEAQVLMNNDPRNSEVLFEYMNGQDFMRSPMQQGSRWIINFFDWPEEKARRYPDCFAIVEEKVKPYRQERKPNGEFKRRKPLPQLYWVYAEKRPRLYRTIQPLNRVLCRPITAAQHAFAFVELPKVIDQTAPVYVFDDDFHLAVLQSEVHAVWWLRHGPTFGASPRYVPSDVFETFPIPSYSDELQRLGRVLEKERGVALRRDQIGLTEYYRRLNDRSYNSTEILAARSLHQLIAAETLRAYGWNDLEPTLTFRELRGRRQRLTLLAEVTDEILERLLELNKERFEAEEAKGLHDRKKKMGKRAPRNQGSLLRKSL